MVISCITCSVKLVHIYSRLYIIVAVCKYVPEKLFMLLGVQNFSAAFLPCLFLGLSANKFYFDAICWVTSFHVCYKDDKRLYVFKCRLNSYSVLKPKIF